jgi:hypothetical protein
VMNRTEQIRSHAGPSLLALAIVHTLLVAASIVAGGANTDRVSGGLITPRDRYCLRFEPR